jgi:hypothetical protein
MLAGGVVVDDEMDIELVRNRLFDVAQEREKLLMAMPVLILSDHATGADLERSEEGGRSVADVIVRDSFDIAQPERQEGLGATECLDLALLVDARTIAWSGGWR